MKYSEMMAPSGSHEEAADQVEALQKALRAERRKSSKLANCLERLHNRNCTVHKSGCEGKKLVAAHHRSRGKK